jgi:hypothetical protein
LTLHLSEILASGLLLALPIAGIALDCTSAVAPTEASCSDLCLIQLQCGQTLEQCQNDCQALQKTCTSSGHPSAFQAYAVCAEDAGFTCIDGSAPMVNAPCGPEQYALEECKLEVDGGFDIPDAALVADMMCASPTGGCVSCCQMNHQSGSKTFAAAVEACECGDAGACAVPCASECAGHLDSPDAQPQPGDSCDTCLTQSLNDQVGDAGTCVAAVTAACNRTLDCALYVNCATQMGCTN